MKKILFLLLISTTVFAQQNLYTHQVFILNEGYFNYMSEEIIVPVTLGVYDPSSYNYSVFDTIDGARFASDVLIDEQYVYVAADGELLKYDKDTYSLLESKQIEGIRNMAIWNDKILVSRGEYDSSTLGSVPFNSFLHVYNKEDLSFYTEFDTITGPKWSTQNIIVNGNYAYVIINNAFEWGNEKGLIGKVDLITMSYLTEYDLGVDGKNPDNLMQSGDVLYTVNNKDWSSASISKIDLLSNSIITTNLNQEIMNGCGTSVLRYQDKIYYQYLSDLGLYVFDGTINSVIDSIITLNTNFYALDLDPITGDLYTSSTDFTSSGYIIRLDENNTPVDTFYAGVSPGNFAFDLRELVALSEYSNTSFILYPNPSAKQINIKLDKLTGDYMEIELLDFLGNMILSSKINNKNTSVDISSLVEGVYVVRLLLDTKLIANQKLLIH